MRNYPTPNTAEPFQGKTPQELVYHYAKAKHFCPSCRTRWVEANSILCELCVARRVAERAKTRRRKTKDTSRQPRMAEVVIAQAARGKTKSFIISILSDMGRLFALTGLESADVRDLTEGKAKITTFRARSAKAGADYGR